MGSLGNPWLCSWQAPAGWTFVFPPLRDSLLFEVASRIAFGAPVYALVLVPKWPSKNYYHLLCSSSTLRWTFSLRCRHAAFVDASLPAARVFTLFCITPASQRAACDLGFTV